MGTIFLIWQVLARPNAKAYDEKLVLLFLARSAAAPTESSVAAPALVASAAAAPAVAAQESVAAEQVGKSFQVLQKTVLRAAYEMDSEKAGVLPAGETIVALAARVNETGVLRIQCAAGWVSAVSSTGAPILEAAKVVDEEVVGAYACVQKSVIRAGFEMDSERLGTIEVRWHRSWRTLCTAHY